MIAIDITIIVTNRDSNIEFKMERNEFLKTPVLRFLTLALLCVLVFWKRVYWSQQGTLIFLQSAGAQKLTKGITLIRGVETNAIS